MDASKSYGFKKVQPVSLRKYDQMLSSEGRFGSERSTHIKKDRKGVSPLSSNFLERIKEIKDNKMSPVLHISTDRSPGDYSKLNSSRTPFNQTNTSLNASFKNPSTLHQPNIYKAKRNSQPVLDTKIQQLLLQFNSAVTHRHWQQKHVSNWQVH